MTSANYSWFFVWRESKLNCVGSWAGVTSVFVSPCVFYQDEQAVFLPHPSVTTWYDMMKWQCKRPWWSRWEQISWRGMSHIVWPSIKTRTEQKCVEAYVKNHHIIVNCENTACLVALCETCARLRHILVFTSGWLQHWRPNRSVRTLSSWRWGLSYTDLQWQSPEEN